MSRHTMLLLLLCGVMCGVYFWTQHPAPCRTPVLYKVGTIDPRFHLDERTVSQSLRQAEILWEKAAGRNLFIQIADAPLSVHFVFDTRQHATQVQQRLLPQLQQAEALHTSMAQSYRAWRTFYEDKRHTYDAAHAGYQSRMQVYNAEVRASNARDNVAPATQHTLETTRAELETTRTQLRAIEQDMQESIAVLRNLEEREKILLATYARQIHAYNRLSRAQRQFHKGEFNGRDITVYQFRAAADLVLVLAHELGHALGLTHVEDERAVMHELISAQDLAPLRLTAADRQALRAACGNP